MSAYIKRQYKTNIACAFTETRHIIF